MSVLFRLAAEGRITVLLVDTRAGHIILREIVYSMQYSTLPWFLLKRLNISWWYFFQVFTSKLNWLKSEFCKKIKGNKYGSTNVGGKFVLQFSTIRCFFLSSSGHFPSLWTGYSFKGSALRSCSQGKLGWKL